MIPRILDRYVSREFARIFAITALGFPIFTMLINITDRIDTYLARGVPGQSIALAYLYTMAEQVFFIIPAAVLFATVFSVGALSRHSEVTAAKASGISFQRLVAPVFLLAAVASILAYLIGEMVPRANERSAQLLGDAEIRSQNARYNFVYRADGGRTYTIRQLIIPTRDAQDIQIEREGAGENPGYFLTAEAAAWTDSTGWTLRNGVYRLFLSEEQEVAMSFQELHQRAMTEAPADLLTEPKAPDQMTIAELRRYIRTLERSGSDANKLKVELAMKIAIPATCIVIALFGAPLGLTGQRTGAAAGVAVSLATTIVFLLAVQISKAVGAGGLLPPLIAAWVPNAGFGVAGLILFVRART
jgi:lipopolysaccharide export system permease protein